MSIESPSTNGPIEVITDPLVVPADLFPEFIGGIPSSVFRPGNKDTTHDTLSGHGVTFDMAEGHFRLHAADIPDIKFTARRYSNNRQPLMGVDAHTKLADGTYHPDFRAGQLVDAVVTYFNHFNLRQLVYIEGLWGPESDNYAQFEASMALFGADPSDIQELAAANSTWSGRTANANGFYAESVKHMGNGHSALFALDAPNYQMPK